MNEGIDRELLNVLGIAEEALRKAKVAILARDKKEVKDLSYGDLGSLEEFELKKKGL